MSEQPSRGVKQKSASQDEALLKKHTMEFTKWMKYYEEMKASGNGKHEEYEAIEKGWRKTTEEILSLMKELTGRTSEQKVKENLGEGQKEVSQSQGSGKKIDEETEEQSISVSE